MLSRGEHEQQRGLVGDYEDRFCRHAAHYFNRFNDPCTHVDTLSEKLDVI